MHFVDKQESFSKASTLTRLIRHIHINLRLFAALTGFPGYRHGSREVGHHSDSVLCDIQHQRHANDVSQKIRSSITDERQRNTGNRHKADRHGDILEHMKEKHRHHADNDELPKLIKRVSGKIQHSENHQDIKRHNQYATQNPTASPTVAKTKSVQSSGTKSN